MSRLPPTRCREGAIRLSFIEWEERFREAAKVPGRKGGVRGSTGGSRGGGGGVSREREVGGDIPLERRIGDWKSEQAPNQYVRGKSPIDMCGLNRTERKERGGVS
jgi:hypothetical protein